MELKIIEPIQHYSKEFNSADEFNIWYSKNKAIVDKLTTHKLNKMYHIDGYRITRIKNELMLKKYDKNNPTEATLELSLHFKGIVHHGGEVKSWCRKSFCLCVAFIG